MTRKGQVMKKPISSPCYADIGSLLQQWLRSNSPDPERYGDSAVQEFAKVFQAQFTEYDRANLGEISVSTMRCLMTAAAKDRRRLKEGRRSKRQKAHAFILSLS